MKAGLERGQLLKTRARVAARLAALLTARDPDPIALESCRAVLEQADRRLARLDAEAASATSDTLTDGEFR